MRKLPPPVDPAPRWRPEELPTDPAGRARYLALCQSPLWDLLRYLARDRAMHRLWLEDQTQHFDAMPLRWEQLPPDEQASRIDHEAVAFFEMTDAEDANRALRRWVKEQERWPPAGQVVHAWERFTQEVDRRRRSLDPGRAGNDPVATLWRRHCPAWAMGMKGDAANAFDWLIHLHHDRVEAYFREHAAQTEG